MGQIDVYTANTLQNFLIYVAPDGSERPVFHLRLFFATSGPHSKVFRLFKTFLYSPCYPI